VKAWPSITVTIAQWGKVGFTQRCIDALLRSDYEGDLEILVYDNDSPGGPGPLENHESVTLICGDSNIGFGPAHNRLAERGSGDLLIVLNNDTIVTPSAVSRMVTTLSGSDGIGAVGPRYLGFGGTNLELGGFIGNDGSGWQLFRDQIPPAYMTRAPFLSDYVSAACLLTNRTLFLETGGFDDMFAPAYYEDTDYCFRLAEQGLRVLVEPTAVVYHYEGATAGKDVSTGMKQLQVEHKEVFAERWADRLCDRMPISAKTAFAAALDCGGGAVLWISPEMPRPDHEAGHARMVSMLRTLRTSGAVVVLWAEMAPEWERYAPLLEDAGIPWFAFRTSGRLADSAEGVAVTVQELLDLGVWNVVVVSFPGMAGRMLSEIRTRAPDTPLIVDAVDLHFVRLGRKPGISESELERARKAELWVYRAADGVITAGDHELDTLEELLPGVPARGFVSVPTIEVVAEPLSSEGGDIVFLGNFNHPPNAAAVDQWVSQIHPRLSGEVRRPLALFGSGTGRFVDQWPSEAVTVGGWVPELQDVFRSARIFVVPLTFGAGTKGKILEAATAGVPIVSTSIGAEGYYGPLRDALVVADDPQEFAEAIGLLMTDDVAWREARDRTFEAVVVWEATAEIERSEWAAWLKRRRRLV